MREQKTPKKLREDIAGLVDMYADAIGLQKPFIPGQSHVPVSGKVIGARELQFMVDACLDGWLTTGRFNAMFEEKLASRLGIKHVLTVNSGSSANLVAFSALTSHRLGKRAIRPGDQVITVAAGFPTTVNPIIQFGAIPVFVDVDIVTHNIDVSLMESAMGPKVKAVMLAHALGNPFDLDAVQTFCRKHNIWLIEDCCDALGSTYDGRHVGTFGDIATLSFYPAHHITMGEGGAIFTDNDELKRIAESYRDWGRDCYCPPGHDNTCNRRYQWKLGELPEGYDHKYIYTHAGYNLKITDMQAACGLAQLERLDEFVAARKANFRYLKERLERCSEYLLLPEETRRSDPSWFGFPVMIRPESGIDRVDLLKHLQQHRIGTRLLFGGNLVRQPYMHGCAYEINGSLERTDLIMNHLFWLGVFPGLHTEQLDYIAETLEDYFRRSFPHG